jgi:DNA-binding transcriptional LysR family regulator
MPHNIDMDLLRALAAVVDTGGFSRAAGLLGRTQSAVSMQIKRLEDMLEQPLLDRSGRTVLPTAQGECLMGYARRILDLNDQAWQALTQRELEGTVRLGCPDDYAAAYLPAVLSGFAVTHPRVRVQVHGLSSVTLIDMVARNELDLAIATRIPDREPGEFLLRDRLVWVVAPGSDVLSRTPVPLSLGRPTCIFRALALPLLDQAGVRWQIAYESQSANGMQSAVEAGLAAMLLLRSTVPSHLKSVTVAPGMPPLPELDMALFRAPGATNEVTQRLSDHILTQMRGLGANLMRGEAA